MYDFSMGLSLLAADVADQPVVPQVDAADIGWRLLMVITLFVVPYIVGAFLARALRLKEYSNRIGTVLLATVNGIEDGVHSTICLSRHRILCLS